MGTMTMELLILVLAIPSAYLVARHTYRMHHRVAALLSVDSDRGRRPPVDFAGGAVVPVESAPGEVASPGSVSGRTASMPVRITSVLVLDRSLLVAVTPHGRASTADEREQVLLAEVFESDGGAAIAVLNRWCETGTPVVIELGSNRLTFQARGGSSIVLAAAG
jgi:hypothetical protein